MKTQGIAAVISILLALGLASPVQAQDRASELATGFYGGLSLRDRASDAGGVTVGSANVAWNRFVAPTADDTASRALLFGGYRFRNDVAVEASFNTAAPLNTVDMYTLRPLAGAGGRRGVGLNFAANAGLGDLQARSWNVDVFTSWTFYRSLALYGRLGYAQSDTIPAFGNLPPLASDPRRLRDGVNVGVGLRYDMNSALGLRVEYGRFGRFAGEIGNGLPETDQVTFGIQLRF